MKVVIQTHKLNKMTVKEAILQSLTDIDGLTNYQEVCQHIINKGYYDLRKQKHLLQPFLPCWEILCVMEIHVLKG